MIFPLLDLIAVLIKVALFLGPIVVLHWVTSAQALEIAGRRSALTGALLMFIASLAAFWISMWDFFEVSSANWSAADVAFRTSDAGILALGFAVGIMIQVIRFRKANPTLYTVDEFQQPLVAYPASVASKQDIADKF